MSDGMMRVKIELELRLEMPEQADLKDAVLQYFFYHGNLPARALLGGMSIMDVRKMEPWEGVESEEGESPWADDEDADEIDGFYEEDDDC